MVIHFSELALLAMSMGRTVWGATTTGSTTDFTAVCLLAERPLSDSACRIVITDTAVVFILRQSYMSQMCAIVYWKYWMLIFFKIWYESTIPNVRRVHLLVSRDLHIRNTAMFGSNITRCEPSMVAVFDTQNSGGVSQAIIGYPFDLSTMRYLRYSTPNWDFIRMS